MALTARQQATLAEIQRDSTDPYAVMGSPQAGPGSQNYLVDQQAAAAAPTTPVYTGPSQAQLNPLMSALTSTDSMRGNQRNEAAELYRRNMEAYKVENAQDKENYNKQVSQNEGNLATNRWAALLQGAQGAQGLRAVLGSLGALSGSGGVLADRAIASAANRDIGEADQTFTTNADSLNTAWQTTERDQRQRDIDAKAAQDNELKAADSSWATARQGVLTQLANLFGVGSSQGNQYASEAASLYPTIAQGSNRVVGEYQTPGSLYSQQALDTYKGGVRDLSVSARGGATPGGPALIAAPTPRRRDEEVI